MRLPAVQSQCTRSASEQEAKRSPPRRTVKASPEDQIRVVSRKSTELLELPTLEPPSRLPVRIYGACSRY